ncbi:hypothetical protein BGZ50_000295, partial [Haplosporangium sp. Z 11]
SCKCAVNPPIELYGLEKSVHIGEMLRTLTSHEDQALDNESSSTMDVDLEWMSESDIDDIEADVDVVPAIQSAEPSSDIIVIDEDNTAVDTDVAPAIQPAKPSVEITEIDEDDIVNFDFNDGFEFESDDVVPAANILAPIQDSTRNDADVASGMQLAELAIDVEGGEGDEDDIINTFDFNDRFEFESDDSTFFPAITILAPVYDNANADVESAIDIQPAEPATNIDVDVDGDTDTAVATATVLANVRRRRSLSTLRRRRILKKKMFRVFRICLRKRDLRRYIREYIAERMAGTGAIDNGESEREIDNRERELEEHMAMRDAIENRELEDSTGGMIDAIEDRELEDSMEES